MKEFYKEAIKLVEDKESFKKLTFESIMYIGHVVHLRKKTEEDLKLGFEIDKMRLNKNLSYEKWLSNQIYFNQKDFFIDTEDIGYFLDKEEAIYAIENNLGDINDGGVYNYAVIEGLRLNKVYPSATSETSYDLFKYDYTTDTYIPIDWNTNEETKAIHKTFDSLV